MHDPMTVAHEIYLGAKKNKKGHYQSPLITIWHVDPENDGTDDSCGWSFPKISQAEKDWLKKVAEDQYPQLFARKVALSENRSYASICYNQDVHGCIYWLWRHFNRTLDKSVWQYGKPLSNKEQQFVYELAFNPGADNFQHTKINGVKDFEEFASLVYRSWKRYKRPWHKHPRWHICHWKIQFHPWQNIKRRYWDRCSVCGKRGFKSSAMGNWEGTKVWHQECDNSFIKSNPQQ